VRTILNVSDVNSERQNKLDSAWGAEAKIGNEAKLFLNVTN